MQPMAGAPMYGAPQQAMFGQQPQPMQQMQQPQQMMQQPMNPSQAASQDPFGAL